MLTSAGIPQYPIPIHVRTWPVIERLRAKWRGREEGAG